MESLVTVLTPTYNSGSYLREAILSVRAQTYENWKMVIVDDGSTDNSLELIDDLLEDKRITLIRNLINKGPAVALNTGLKEIDTPFILKLDSDDSFFPNTIEILLNAVKDLSDDVALVCGNKQVVVEDPHGNVLTTVNRTGGDTFDDPYEFLLANYVPFPRFYRTKALREVGGWSTDDPYNGRYIEDRRIDVKLIEKYKIVWIDEMLYKYRKHAKQQTSDFKINNEMIEWNIRDALKRWGDHYEPIFSTEKGWRVLIDLKKKSLLND